MVDNSFKNNKFENTAPINIASASDNVEQKILIGEESKELIDQINQLIEASEFVDEDSKIEAQDNIGIVQDALVQGDLSKAERFFKKLPNFIKTAASGVALIAQIQGII